MCVTDLSDEVEQHKAGGEEISTAPRALDVVSLLTPLEPHAYAVLQKRADETQTRQVRKILFSDPQELQEKQERDWHSCQSNDIMFTHSNHYNWFQSVRLS